MSAIYYLTPDGGNGFSPDGTLPTGAIACTEAQYGNASAWKIDAGNIVATTPPVASLADQAGVALAIARVYVRDNYTILNEATPDAWVVYLKALMAIANGTDTASTILPTSPQG